MSFDKNKIKSEIVSSSDFDVHDDYQVQPKKKGRKRKNLIAQSSSIEPKYERKSSSDFDVLNDYQIQQKKRGRKKKNFNAQPANIELKLERKSAIKFESSDQSTISNQKITVKIDNIEEIEKILGNRIAKVVIEKSTLNEKQNAQLLRYKQEANLNDDLENERQTDELLNYKELNSLNNDLDNESIINIDMPLIFDEIMLSAPDFNLNHNKKPFGKNYQFIKVFKLFK
jgi:hypothetical protein